MTEAVIGRMRGLGGLRKLGKLGNRIFSGFEMMVRRLYFAHLSLIVRSS